MEQSALHEAPDRAVSRLPAGLAIHRFGPWILFLLWVVAAVGVALERPGRLLEVALIGLTGVVAFLVISRADATQDLRSVASQATFALAGAAAILVATWPVQVWALGTAHIPRIGAVLANPPAILLVAGLVLLAVGPRRRPPALLALAGAALAAGALIATAAAQDRGAATVALVLALAAPAAWGLLAAMLPVDAAQAWRIVEVWLAASLAVFVVAIAAYAVEFGIPTSGTELMANKLDLYRPHLIQTMTLGNLGHLADLTLLVIPLAVCTAARPRVAGSRRALGLAALLAAVVALILTVERGPLLFSLAGLVVLALVFAVRRQPALAVAVPAVTAGVLLLVVLSPGVRGYVAGLSSTSSEVTSGPPTGGPSTGETAPQEVNDRSTETRLDAMRNAIDIFVDHPEGVGPGQYARYDPVHTAPHTLSLEVLAEDGVIGALGLVLLLAAALAAIVLWARAPRDSPGLLLRAGLIGGACLYLAEALAAGSAFAVGNVNVWVVLLWLELGLAAALVPRRLARHASR